MFKNIGTAWLFDDDINTDYIVASRRKKDTLDLNILKNYLMEDIRPGFGRLVKRGDILVAGENFGCGSAMEIATLIISYSGITVIIAKSFSRTFCRNGINGGLILLSCDTSNINEGDILSIEINSEKAIVHNKTKGRKIECNKVPRQLFKYVTEGGLISYFNKHSSL